MHKQDGFCARCGHYLLLPPGFTAAQRTAAVELHALDWCPRACAAVIGERQVKRRRLDLVGREGGSSVHSRPIITSGLSHAAQPVAACAISPFSCQ
ncbi:zinc finger protein [Wuchereria bancrofti]|uniref:Zinc finger protein n=1 Tax=Wuchereria bancrofti TaxID=6293 RepID=J9A9L7_WUCBA|nr:zinc finger protein [Wuchereria bancrofti]